MSCELFLSKCSSSFSFYNGKIEYQIDSQAATMYSIGNLIYIFTIEGHPQTWNFPEVEEDKNEIDEKLIVAPKAEHEETERL